MATISEIVNNLSCGTGQQAGTGLKFCPQDIKDPKVVVFAEKGLALEPPLGTDFNLAFLQTLQQKGKLIILNRIVSFTDNTSENETATRESSGIKYGTMLPPYDYTFTFDNGVHFYRNLSKLEGSKNLDMFIFDVKNDMFGTLTRQNKFRGFDLLYVGVGPYKAGKENSQTLMVQFDRTQFDTSVAWISNENLDFTATTDLDGYNDVEIKIIAPTDSTSIVNFNIFAKANNKLVALTGLDVSDFKLIFNGATEIPLSIVPNGLDGAYTFNLANPVSAGYVISLELFDNTLLTSIINLEGTMFKSNIATTVVV